MMYKKLAILAAGALLLTGCAKETPAEPEAAVTEAAETEPETEPVTEAPGEPVEIRLHGGGTAVLSGADREIGLRFYPLLSGVEVNGDPHDLLTKLAEYYDTKKAEYGEKIDSELKKMQATAPCLFLTERGFYTAADFDPFYAALLERQADLNVNPIELAENVTKGALIGCAPTEWFPYTCPAAPADQPEKELVGAEECLQWLAKYGLRLSQKPEVSYSEEEDLYYLYVMDGRQAHAMAIHCLYLRISEEKIMAIGIETYIRSHTELTGRFSDMSYPEVFGMEYGSIFSLDREPMVHDIGTSSGPGSLISFRREEVCPAHTALCDAAEALLQSRNAVNVTRTNTVRFEEADDFHSAMNKCMHLFGGHYLSWYYPEP